MTSRIEKGLELAKANKLRSARVWVVPSQKPGESYMVEVGEKGMKCNCPDFAVRKKKCKHIWAVVFTREFEEEGEKPSSLDR